MARRYQVAYVGNDSLDHVVNVTAENHNAAIEVVKRDFDADVIIAVGRAPIFGVRRIWRLVGLALVALLAAMAYFARRTDATKAVSRTVIETRTETPVIDDVDWGRP